MVGIHVEEGMYVGRIVLFGLVELNSKGIVGTEDGTSDGIPNDTAVVGAEDVVVSVGTADSSMVGIAVGSNLTVGTNVVVACVGATDSNSEARNNVGIVDGTEDVVCTDGMVVGTVSVGGVVTVLENTSWRQKSRKVHPAEIDRINSVTFWLLFVPLISRDAVTRL